MNEERSYIEYRGMPLQAAPHAGFLNYAPDAPWFNTFDARRLQAVEQKHADIPGQAMPDIDSSIPWEELEGSEPFRRSRVKNIEESRATPNPMQSSPTAIFPNVQPGSVVKLDSNVSAPVDADPSVPSVMGASIDSPDPEMFVKTPQLAPDGNAERRTAHGSDSVTANPTPESVRDLNERTRSAMHSPHALARNQSESRLEVPVMAGAAESVTMSRSPLAARLSVDMELPRMMAGAAKTPTMESQTASTRLDVSHSQMGSDRAVANQDLQRDMPVIPLSGERSRQVLLERLNENSAAPSETSRRRVHIANLHITVQRPALVSAPPQAAAPSEQPSSAEQSPVFFNPWERPNPAFD